MTDNIKFISSKLEILDEKKLLETLSKIHE